MRLLPGLAGIGEMRQAGRAPVQPISITQPALFNHQKSPGIQWCQGF